MSTSYSLDFARLEASYACGRLAPAAVASEVLDRIAAAPHGGVWIHVVPRNALLERARELERRRALGERMPLYGLPYAVKDNIDVAGLPTTAACPAYAYSPDRSASVVQQLDAAGALCIGKTNMDQFATGLVGTRSPYGACPNPFDPRYIAGGSSAGSAAAVALGHVSFALGTDTAGSGRVPAGFCNIVGLKPTRGVVSTSGTVPACRSLDCISIFALTVPDAWAAYESVQRYDAADPYSRTDRPRTSPPPARMRFGVPRSSQRAFFGDGIAQAAFDRALALVGSMDCEVVDIDYTPYAEAARLLYDGPWVAERLAAIKAFFSKSAGEMHPVVRDIVAAAQRYGAVDAFEAAYRLAELKLACDRQWHSIDALLLPTAGAFYRIDEVERAPVELNTRLGYYTNFVNLLDCAALAVPAPFRADGLPFGITLVGPAGSDATLARAGAALHRAAQVSLGATGIALPDERPLFTAAADETVTLAVVGAHLSGLPLNGQLTARGARLIETTTTAPHYRLHALADAVPPKPALVRVAEGGSAIEVELWSLPLERFGAFVAAVPAPLAIGTLTLADGREVKGFLGEPHALADARDITEYGGWRRYLAAHTRAAELSS